MRRVGADVGGTFTDVVVSGEDGRVTFAKVLSTPRAYEDAVIEAVGSLGGADEVVHGTTVATNAVLERRGARAAVVTTEGFRDVLELRRMRMPHLYDYFWTKPPPLVERRVAAILRAELPGVPVSLSSEILREQQEYERTATTVVNAYVRPLMARYVADLQDGLGG